MAVMPLVAQEPWKWAEQEANTNNALYELFLKQKQQSEEFALSRQQQDKIAGLQQSGAMERQTNQQNFARDSWNWKTSKQEEEEGARQSAKLDADTVKFANEIASDIVKEFNIPEHAARGMVAEAMAESGDFKQMQELKPLVPGSRGGLNIMQWTGPRRVALEQFAARNGMDPSDKSTGRAFLIEELKGPEGRKLLPHLMKSKDAWAAAQATRQIFLRPQSVQEGWQDAGRDRRVRQRLFLGEQPAQPTQTATAANTQPTPGQQQPTNTPSAPTGARPKLERFVKPDGSIGFKEIM